MLKILIVEDAPNLRARLVDELTRRVTGYEIVATDNRAEAMRLLVSEEPNLLLLDLVIPPRAGEPALDWTEGRDVLRTVKRNLPHVKVIVLTSRGDLARDFLVEEGADDFFTKDAADAWMQGKLLTQIEALIGYIVCRSAAMQQTRRQLGKIRENDALVVIEGEIGTGKKYLARVIHRCSRRAARRLEHLPCASLNARTFLPQLVGVSRCIGNHAGLLESPEVETILLDGVDDLDEEAQEQLARLLAGVRGGMIHFQPVGGTETLTSDVRLILTLTDSPRHLHTRRRLTYDLYARIDPALSPIAKYISVPPLRERKEDVPDLAYLFLTKHVLAAPQKGYGLETMPLRGFDPRCLELLAACEFAGNAAQLERVIAAAVHRAEGDVVLPQHLDLPLPEEYVVRCSRGAGVEERRVSRAGLIEFTDAAQFDLIVELADDGSVSQARVKEQPVKLSDPRLSRLLVLLMQQAGTPVDLKPYRRTLGIAASEPLKRYIFKLRQLLGDTEVADRASEFFTSHYGERYSFNATSRFALIRRLSEEKVA